MLIRTRRSWELPESAATPEAVWMNRRAWLKGAGFAGSGLPPPDWCRPPRWRPSWLPVPTKRGLSARPRADRRGHGHHLHQFLRVGSSKNIWKKPAR